MTFTLVTGACPYVGDIKCNDTGRCYRSNIVCNGNSSCSNGDDETNCGNDIVYLLWLYSIETAFVL